MNPIGLQLRAALTFCAQTSVAWRNRVIQTLTSISRPLQSPFYRLAVVISGIFNTTNLVGFQNPSQNHCEINSFAIALFHTAPHVDIPSDDQDANLEQLHQELEEEHTFLNEAQEALSQLKIEIETQIKQPQRTQDEIRADVTKTWQQYNNDLITAEEHDGYLTTYKDELSKCNKLELNQKQAKQYQTLIEKRNKTIQTILKEIQNRKDSLDLARKTLSILRREQHGTLTPQHASAFKECHPNSDTFENIKPLYEGKPPKVKEDITKNKGKATILQEALKNPKWRVIRLGGNLHWQALVRNVNNNTVTLVNDNWITPNYMTIDAIYAKWSQVETWSTLQLTFYSTLD